MSRCTTYLFPYGCIIKGRMLSRFGDPSVRGDVDQSGFLPGECYGFSRLVDRHDLPRTVPETRSLDDVRKVTEVGRKKVFRIMLDNFTPAQIKEALKLISGEFATEASGGINLNNLEEYAKTGVDYVSIGALIHQAKSLDLSLKAIII